MIMSSVPLPWQGQDQCKTKSKRSSQIKKVAREYQRAPLNQNGMQRTPLLPRVSSHLDGVRLLVVGGEGVVVGSRTAGLLRHGILEQLLGAVPLDSGDIDGGLETGQTWSVREYSFRKGVGRGSGSAIKNHGCSSNTDTLAGDLAELVPVDQPSFFCSCR